MNPHKRIHLWIVNQYATIPARGGSCRHFMLARHLAKSGFLVTILAGAGHHLHRDPPRPDGAFEVERLDGVNIVWVRTPFAGQRQYLRRLFAWIVFSIRLMLVAGKFDRPTTVLHSSPSLVPFIVCQWIAWRSRADLLFEFRDIWPMTFTDIGRKSSYHPLSLLHSWLEKWAIHNCKLVIGVMEQGWRRVEELGAQRGKYLWIPNGVETAEDSCKREILPPDLDSVLTNPTLNLVYAGSLGQTNAIELILDAAAICRECAVQFIIVGDGTLRTNLEKCARNRHLSNVLFFDAIPKRSVRTLLLRADALIICWRDGPLYRYGTSANKIAEYLASGRPIIQAYSGAADVVMKSKSGITVPSGDAQAFATAIADFLRYTPEQRKAMGAAGRRYASENLSFEVLAKRLAEVIR